MLQVEAPDEQEEGSHIAISADCKGVRILKSEREEIVKGLLNQFTEKEKKSQTGSPAPTSRRL